jgi:glycosyltransferase involved in cell wall biosynthesis
MKILFHHRIASRDGQAVHMDELRGALETLGHTVILVGPPLTGSLEFGGHSGAVAFLKRKIPAAIYELMELGYNVIAVCRLWRAVRKHEADAIYERYNLYAIAGVIVRRVLGVPLLLEVNAPIFEEREALDGLACSRMAAWSQRVAWRGADLVLPVTNVIADFVRRTGVGEERIAMIPNGIDRDRFAALPGRSLAKRQLGLDDRLVLGFVGFVRSWNGVDRVLDAMAGLDTAMRVHLLLVGDGPARAALEERAKTLGIADRLTVTGVVKRAAIPAHIAAFDIALLPDVTAYASPLKLFEYMAAGLAIIAPDRRNIREVLTNGLDSILIDPDRSEGLAAAIATLCRDEALRVRLGAAARATIDHRGLTWLNNARRVSDLLAELSQRTPPLS